MTKKLILIGILLIIITGGIVAAAYFVNSKEVTFTLEKTNYTVVIHNEKEQQIASLNQSSSIRLQEGTYSYTVKGDDYDNAPEFFDVTEDTEVTVSPQFTKEYLSRILETEEETIRSVIQSTYAGRPEFTIQTLEVYDDGNWAGGTFTQNVDPRQLPDIYRFVLHKNAETDEWKVIVPPTIAIDKNTYKNVPVSVLYALYDS